MPLLEVCVDSIAGLRAAEEGGAARIELCLRLDLGGLSPDRELLEAASESARLPLHVMVRPRPGSFVYTESEILAMEREILSLRELEVAGVVLGALTEDRRIDSAALRRLLAAARPMSVTFHRAFDEVADPLTALDELVALGVDRLLTSGGAPDAYRGRKRLGELVRRARGRIVVMAGGGVRASNAAAILADAGVAELHGSVPFRLAE
jgi:copper homeostasis protein